MNWSSHPRFHKDQCGLHHGHILLLEPYECYEKHCVGIKNLLEDHKKFEDCDCKLTEYLRHPVPRKTAFSLKELSRAVICDKVTHEKVSELGLPASLNDFMREYQTSYKYDENVFQCNEILPILGWFQEKKLKKKSPFFCFIVQFYPHSCKYFE